MGSLINFLLQKRDTIKKGYYQNGGLIEYVLHLPTCSLMRLKLSSAAPDLLLSCKTVLTNCSTSCPFTFSGTLARSGWLNFCPFFLRKRETNCKCCCTYWKPALELPSSPLPVMRHGNTDLNCFYSVAQFKSSCTIYIRLFSSPTCTCKISTSLSFGFGCSGIVL